MGDKMTRRNFLNPGAMAPGAGAAAGASPEVGSPAMLRAKVYAKVGQDIGGKVAIKLHTGEPHGPNLLSIGLIKGPQAAIPHSAIVENQDGCGSTWLVHVADEEYGEGQASS